MSEIKFSKTYLTEILDKFITYINETEFPILSEFAYLNNLTLQQLKDFRNRKPAPRVVRDSIVYDFTLTYKKALHKSETYLVKRSMKQGQNSAPMFLLKAIHQYREYDDQKASETHIHLHQNADRASKMSDQEVNDYIANELLKADNKKKSPRKPAN